MKADMCEALTPTAVPEDDLNASPDTVRYALVVDAEKWVAMCDDQAR